MWMIGTVTNDSDEQVWIAYGLGPHTTIAGSEIHRTETAEITIGHRGSIYLRTETHPESTHGRALVIESSLGTTRWSPAGAGVLDVHVHQDASFTLTGDGEEIVNGTVLMPHEIGVLAAQELGHNPPAQA